MKIAKFLLSLFVVAMVFSCEDNNSGDNNGGSSSASAYYKERGMELVSRLYMKKSDMVNHPSVEVIKMDERSGKRNFIAETQYATTSYFYGRVNNIEMDLVDRATMSVAHTNKISNHIPPGNPYLNQTEWDYNTAGDLSIVYNVASSSFFLNYFGGNFSGYYNATSGLDLFSFKKFPTGYGGYVRDVNGKAVYVDLYRKKAFAENKSDSSWLALDLPVATTYGVSFDFETANSNYGVAAWLTSVDASSGKVNAMAYNGTTWSTPVAATTGKVTQFAGWDGAYTVAVCKNGSDANKPYVVIRRNQTASIYKYDIAANTLTEVHNNVAMPQSLYFSSSHTFGNSEVLHEFLFSQDAVYLLHAKKHCRLESGAFVQFIPYNFPVEDVMLLSTAESTSNGLYLAYTHSDEQGRNVADIVKIKN